MGDRTPADSEEKGTVNRRGFMQGVAGVVGVAALGTSGLAAAQTTTTINLGDEGLSPGDDITPYLEEYWQSGAHVIIPGGTYQFSGDPDALTVRASEDSWLEGDGLVTLDTQPESDVYCQADSNNTVRYQNLAFGEEIDAARFVSVTGDFESVVELVNVNLHGAYGTEDAGVSMPGDWGATDYDFLNRGTLRLINCTVTGYSDGLYASSAFEDDHPDDASGTIEIYGGYYANNEVNNIRIGGNDARVVSVTSLYDDPDMPGSGNPIRIRESGTGVEIRDCDVTVTTDSGGRAAIEIRDDKFESDLGGEATIENCRVRQEKDDAEIINVAEGGYEISGQTIHLTGGGDYDMEGQGSISEVYTDGQADAPTTDKRVVDTDTLEPLDGDTGSSTPSDSTEDATPKALDIRTYSDSGIIYEFTVDGAVEGGDTAETSSVGNDSITDNGDGTYTATGTTGNGYTDNYNFGGQVVAWSAERHPDSTSGEYELAVDGTTVTPEELTGSTDDGSTDDGSTDGDSTNDGSTDDSTDGDSTDSTSPVIEEYAVSEAGSMNPHADIIAKWNVSDPDGDLASVLVQVLNSSGVVLAASRSQLGSDSAQDVDYFKIKRVDGQTFDVRLTVTDAQGNTASDVTSVTE